MLNTKIYIKLMVDIFENFNISIGIKKNNKFITIKEYNNDLETAKKEDLEEILNKVHENVDKLKKENKELENQISNLKHKKIESSKINKNIKKKALIENIKKTVIINNIYDDLLLSFEYNNIDKQNFTLLNISENKETVIKTYITSYNIIKEDNELFYDFTNNYKTLKIIANYYNYTIVLYDINESILDTITGTKMKSLNFLFYENKIYPLKQKPFKYSILIPRLNNLINNYKKRDKYRNLRYVLLDQVDKYKNHFIKYKNVGNFKYKYLLDEIDNIKTEKITDETRKIYEYLINNFGLQFYIIENYLKIDINQFNLDFITTYNDFVIPDFPKNEYEYLKENNQNTESYNYYYINEYLRINIFGITKEEIIEKGKNINIIINDTEIKKSLTNLLISDIKTDDDILLIKQLLKNQDYIYYREKPKYESILATDKINLDNSIDADYIIDLYNKEHVNYCKMCNCSLDFNTISIDSVNAMFGHVKKNIQLLCLKCNIFKNIRFIGKYTEKPYYYDINTLSKNKLIEILKYHNLDTNGITFILRKRLEKYIKNID